MKLEFQKNFTHLTYLIVASTNFYQTRTYNITQKSGALPAFR